MITNFSYMDCSCSEFVSIINTISYILTYREKENFFKLRYYKLTEIKEYILKDLRKEIFADPDYIIDADDAYTFSISSIKYYIIFSNSIKGRVARKIYRPLFNDTPADKFIAVPLELYSDETTPYDKYIIIQNVLLSLFYQITRTLEKQRDDKLFYAVLTNLLVDYIPHGLDDIREDITKYTNMILEKACDTSREYIKITNEKEFSDIIELIVRQSNIYCG